MSAEQPNLLELLADLAEEGHDLIDENLNFYLRAPLNGNKPCGCTNAMIWTAIQKRYDPETYESTLRAVLYYARFDRLASDIADVLDLLYPQGIHLGEHLRDVLEEIDEDHRNARLNSLAQVEELRAGPTGRYARMGMEDA